MKTVNFENFVFIIKYFGKLNLIIILRFLLF